MNVVNKMIGDYQKRSGFEDYIPPADEKVSLIKRMHQFHVPWNISLSMFMALAVLIMSSWMLYPMVSEYSGVRPVMDEQLVLLGDKTKPKTAQSISHTEPESNVSATATESMLALAEDPAADTDSLPVKEEEVSQDVVAVDKPLGEPEPEVVAVSKIVKPEVVAAKKVVEPAVVKKPVLKPVEVKSNPQKLAQAHKAEKPKERLSKPALAAKKVVEQIQPENPEPVTIAKKALEPTPEEKAQRSYERAIKYISEGRVAEAEHRLKQALETYRESTEAREALVGLLINSRRWSDVEKLLVDGVEVEPANIRYRQWLARIYVENGKTLQAMQVLSKGKPYAGNNAEYFALLAMTSQAQGSYQEAIDAYVSALNINPAQAKWWLGIGSAYEATEQWPAAEDAYTKAIAVGSLDEKLDSYVQSRLEYIKLTQQAFARQ